MASSVAADSAGVPWEGRSFEHNAQADDDGSAPAELAAALARFSAGTAGEQEVVDALRHARLLIPLVAELGEIGANASGVAVDKRQELSIVTVAGPDGRTVLPVFSSVDTMRAWNPLARPVPADGRRVAVAAAGEETDLVVVDPTSVTEFAVRRPALWAMAQGEPWVPAYLNDAVRGAFEDAAADEPAVASVSLSAGDPTARLAGAELVVELALLPGLGQAQLDALLTRLQSRWAESEIIGSGVDSLDVRLAAAS